MHLAHCICSLGIPAKFLLVFPIKQSWFFWGNGTKFYWKGLSAEEGVDLLVQLLSPALLGCWQDTRMELFVTVRGKPLSFLLRCHSKNNSHSGDATWKNLPLNARWNFNLPVWMTGVGSEFFQPHSNNEPPSFVTRNKGRTTLSPGRRGSCSQKIPFLHP